MIGVEIGNWHYARSGFAWDHPVPSTAPFQLETLGWLKTVLRVVIGVLMVCDVSRNHTCRGTLIQLLDIRVERDRETSLTKVFATYIPGCGETWLEYSQKILHSSIVINRLSNVLLLLIPTRKYKNVPNIKEDNVIPSVSEIPSMLTTLRHPQQSRSVSIGPQSAADAYETLAFRAKRRRESISSVAENIVFSKEGKNHANDHLCISTSKKSESRPVIPGVLPTAVASKLNPYQYITASDPVEYTPPTPDKVLGVPAASNRELSEDRKQYEREDREMFSKLEKPRVRYDVEVVAKLIVYCGWSI